MYNALDTMLSSDAVSASKRRSVGCLSVVGGGEAAQRWRGAAHRCARGQERWPPDGGAEHR